MTPKSILKDMRNLLEAPERWTQGEYARDEKGDYICSRSSRAVCWCLMGAVSKVTGSEKAPDESVAVYETYNLLDSLANKHGEASTADWNDSKGRTHSEVLAFLDEAMQSTEATS